MERILFSVYVSRKPVYNVFAKTTEEAIEKARKKYPNNAILDVRRN